VKITQKIVEVDHYITYNDREYIRREYNGVVCWLHLTDSDWSYYSKNDEVAQQLENAYKTHLRCEKLNRILCQSN